MPDEEAEEAFFAGIANSGPNNHDLPASLTTALAGPDRKEWKAALCNTLYSERSPAELSM